MDRFICIHTVIFMYRRYIHHSFTIWVTLMQSRYTSYNFVCEFYGKSLGNVYTTQKHKRGLNMLSFDKEKKLVSHDTLMDRTEVEVLYFSCVHLKIIEMLYGLMTRNTRDDFPHWKITHFISRGGLIRTKVRSVQSFYLR